MVCCPQCGSSDPALVGSAPMLPDAVGPAAAAMKACDDPWHRTGVVRLPATEQVDHPDHYGGADNPYETIKVIEAWELGFNLGNAVKYIARAGKKGDELEDLKKAAWYLQRQIKNVAKQQERHD